MGFAKATLENLEEVICLKVSSKLASNFLFDNFREKRNIRNVPIVSELGQSSRLRTETNMIFFCDDGRYPC